VRKSLPGMACLCERRGKLEKCLRQLIANVLNLPEIWGDSTTAAADGQSRTLLETVRMTTPIRYGVTGGIKHTTLLIRKQLFSHFIPVETWGVAYVIEGLLKNFQISKA